MVRIGPSQGSPENNQTQGTSPKDKLRIGYNASKKTFGPLQSADTKKMDRMVATKGSVSKLNVPPDYTSSVYLKKVKTEFHNNAKHIKSNNNNVGKYFQGNAANYKDLMNSLASAQKSL